MTHYSFTIAAELFFRSYYSVIVGWCAYYFVTSVVHDPPTDIAASNSTWNELQVRLIVACHVCIYYL